MINPILVVDDDPGFRKLLETILAGEGYPVETAAKVADARRLCSSHSFSLVISDLKLPDGDGLDVQKWFAEHAPHVAFHAADFQLRTDPDMLEQAVLNLLRNAIEAGDQVSLHAEPGLIRVTDNGPGIPPELRPKLFQPFVTTKAQGTGLGLAIVRNLVRALNGNVQLTNARPTGACAEIRWSTK